MSGDDGDRRITRAQIRKLAEGGDLKEEPALKKKKMNNKESNGSSTKQQEEEKTLPEGEDRNSAAKRKKKPTKCKSCRQIVSDIKYFAGDPKDALNEDETITSPTLDYHLEELEDKPSLKVTYYSVYDEYGHLCPFDTGLMEDGVYLYFSGYVKLPHDEDDSKAIPVKMIGPIEEWWIAVGHGNDGFLGFSTDIADYYLVNPSVDYEPFLVVCMARVKLSKWLIEYLTSEPTASFDDALDYVQSKDEQYTLDYLLHNSEFVLTQIMSYDSCADEDETRILTTPCIRHLLNLSGANLEGENRKRRIRKRIDPERKSKDGKPADTLATTTKLVYGILSSAFKEQLEAINGTSAKDKCGVCNACKRQPCKECSGCRGKTKKCLKNTCLRVAVQEADEDEGDLEESEDEMDKDAMYGRMSRLQMTHHKLKERKTNVVWVGRPIEVVNGIKYYNSVKVNGELITKGDCVLVVPETDCLLYIAKIAYMYEDKDGDKHAHANWFWRGTDTILSDTADKNEVFLSDDCDTIPVASITRTCTVLHKTQPPNWRMIGGAENPDEDSVIGPKDDKERTFFYQKWYDYKTARFQDPPEVQDLDENDTCNFCCTCQRKAFIEKDSVPCFSKPVSRNSKQQMFSSFSLGGKEYKVNDCVFLSPNAYEFPTKKQPLPKDTNNVDTADKSGLDYPERYRKSSDFVRGRYVDVPDPFCIARILSISTEIGAKKSVDNSSLKVQLFFRPENTHEGFATSHNSDLNLLYWSNEEATVSLSLLEGKCTVVYEENVKCLEQYRRDGPHRFYFRQAYSKKKRCFVELPTEAKELGASKGNTKNTANNCFEEYPRVGRKLRTLDIFAGCGGLSDGFHQAGISEAEWAIENDKNAAEAFKLNNPNCIVFNEDCNLLLKRVMEGHEFDKRGQRLPRKGEVDLLLGGPPCQGFSGMNRFNSRQYSLFKNSLIATYLSYCDYFRPRFFVLENVRNFVAFKSNMILKLVISGLIRIGYQVAFAVLQAGHYGVPQTRRRAIIIAAAPGEKLPLFPEPLHVFNLRGSQLSVMVDDRKYVSNVKWTTSAPYRVINVRDAMSDLPEVSNGANKYEISYGGPPLSHFQKMMRMNEKKLRDHVCKEMSNLVVQRFGYIPCTPGSDWRDLPNISLRLKDGTLVKKLVYTHNDIKNGKGPKGALRGVCNCAEGEKKTCNSGDRQTDTLIPWCLPHTGNRHNHWAGLYGRLGWDGFFCTTVTNPEPMGKQGCVIHPDQHRVVSVRECARSQGFSDSYFFYGNILDRHRQIGNAVPPPLAAAIAMEFRKCLASEHDD